MLRHVVLFRFREDVKPEERRRERERFRSALLDLASRLPQTVTSLEVGFNSNPAESFDIALIGTFADLAHLQAYSTHPDHVSAVSRLRPFLAARWCVDFEA